MADPAEVKTEELLITIIARLLEGCRLVAAGASSPIPGGGCLLARRHSGGAMHVNILGSRANNLMTNGGVELFDWAGQGRLDAFFLGGGQIDGEANINLVGTGDYPQNDIRWPGSFGSAYLYYLVPRVILFREEHTRRVFVPKVDFVSTPGVSDESVYRTGGPYAMVSPLCLMGFDAKRRRFHLKSVHPGHTIEEVRDNTGFDFDVPDNVPETEMPSRAVLDEIRQHVSREIAETYPRFAERVFDVAA
ncbi:MAG: CoA-transferase [Minwuia sp.]|uniref:CoA-transferase n=1 Tax=Minwuia sp. TaxID=2493630 RepID=UPI003A8A8148